jgi:hypothetical protein
MPMPEGPGEGATTSVQDADTLGEAAVNGSAALSNGRSNGTAPAGSTADSPAAAGAAAAPAQQGFIAHRWRIVLMMAMAFVLCNMDKVRRSNCCCAKIQISAVMISSSVLVMQVAKPQSV